jgi:hypothetical protein
MILFARAHEAYSPDLAVFQALRRDRGMPSFSRRSTSVRLRKRALPPGECNQAPVGHLPPDRLHDLLLQRAADVA